MEAKAKSTPGDVFPLFKHINMHQDGLQASGGLGIFATVHKMGSKYRNGTVRNVKESMTQKM